MISLLSKLFIKNPSAYKDSKTRGAYGILCGIVGIVLNMLLCILKLVVSMLTGSVSVAADAFNNLGDAGSSVITLLGFKLASQKPDPDHPFGHGRMEYLSALIVSMLIVLVGFELGKSSIDKIINGGDTKFSIVAVIILSFSILTKFYIYVYNKNIGKKISSQAMLATATDSISDCVSTFVVLVCTCLTLVSDFNFDGWCGLCVSGFILFSGIKSVKETIDPLLGTPPESDFVNEIEKIVMSYDEIVGIHDLIVHNYGPGRVMISLHAEVNQNIDFLNAHEIIDNAEHKLTSTLNCSAVIHLDPIATDDESVNDVKMRVSNSVKTIDPMCSIHDFRMVIGEGHTNLIFDIVVPYSINLTDNQIKLRVSELIKTIDPKYLTVVNIDRDYTNRK